MPLPDALASSRRRACPGRPAPGPALPRRLGQPATRLALAGLSLSLLAVAALGCRPAPAPRSEPSGRTAPIERDPQRQRLAARQCRQRRDDLLAGLAELRRAEAALAQQRAVAPPPAGAPPLWDEEKESRYSEVDQELDRQRYEQELAAWRQHRAGREAAVAEHRQRLTAAQQRLDRQALLLRRRYPGLFTGPTSIEVKPQELARLSRCPAPPV